METLWAGDARCLQFDCVVQCLGFVLGPGQVPKPCFFFARSKPVGLTF